MRPTAPGPIAPAIETATGDTEVAIAGPDGPLGEIAVRRRRRHVESLHPAIVRVCDDAGIGIDQITVIGVDVGPGLFTGLRVGVTTAKTLAAALGVPLVAVTSLDILAAAAQVLAGAATVVVPVVDMRRGDVAWQLDGAVQYGPPAQLAAALRPRLAAGELDILLVGDGAAARAAEIEAGFGGFGGDGRVRMAGMALATPPARVLAAVTLERLTAGRTDDPLACHPLYLREADAAINWDTRPQRAEVPTAAGS